MFESCFLEVLLGKYSVFLSPLFLVSMSIQFHTKIWFQLSTLVLTYQLLTAHKVLTETMSTFSLVHFRYHLQIADRFLHKFRMNFLLNLDITILYLSFIILKTLPFLIDSHTKIREEKWFWIKSVIFNLLDIVICKCSFYYDP